MVPSAMLIPPEAEPVMPARMFTAMESETSGLPGAMPSTASRTRAKAGSEATTAPNPTSTAVFSAGIAAALAPAPRVSPSRGRRRRLASTVSTMVAASASRIAQYPISFAGSAPPRRGSAGCPASRAGRTRPANSPFSATTSRIGAAASASGGGAAAAAAPSRCASAMSKPSPCAISRSRAGAGGGGSGASAAKRPRRARHSSQARPKPSITAPPISPSPGAAKAVVPKNGIGMAFWIAGVPGSAVMVKVKAPSAMVAGISARGRRARANSSAASGCTAKATTNSDTPP